MKRMSFFFGLSFLTFFETTDLWSYCGYFLAIWFTESISVYEKLEKFNILTEMQYFFFKLKNECHITCSWIGIRKNWTWVKSLLRKYS